MPSYDYRDFTGRWPPSSATAWPSLRVIPGDQPGLAQAHRLDDGKPGAGLLPVAWLAHLTTLLPPCLTGRHPRARRPVPTRERNRPAQPGRHSNCTSAESEHWLLDAADMDSSQTTQRAESLLADVPAGAATGVKGIRFEQGPGARDHEKASVTLCPKSDRCRPIRH